MPLIESEPGNYSRVKAFYSDTGAHVNDAGHRCYADIVINMLQSAIHEATLALPTAPSLFENTVSGRDSKLHMLDTHCFETIADAETSGTCRCC